MRGWSDGTSRGPGTVFTGSARAGRADGKTRVAPGFGPSAVRPGPRRKARDEWLALIPGTHEGYVSWERAETIRKMVSDNVPIGRHHGAPKHGDALLSGLVRCRSYTRKLVMT